MGSGAIENIRLHLQQAARPQDYGDFNMIECQTLIFKAYGDVVPGVEGSKKAPDRSRWPSPGILEASLRWPPTLPSITAEELNSACGVLQELAGASSVVLFSARNALPSNKFPGFIEQVRASFDGNKQLFCKASWAAQAARTTAAPLAQCSTVKMPTMHAAVVQIACNIAEWPAIHGNVDDCRNWLAKMPAVKLGEVGLQIQSESELASKLLTTPPSRTIPPEFRSKAIGKAKAASLLGQNSGPSGVRWLNDCIADGIITCEQQSRQKFVFDLRQFPVTGHEQLRPNSR